jgi:methyl-accepting chemotaxis protein
MTVYRTMLISFVLLLALAAVLAAVTMLSLRRHVENVESVWERERNVLEICSNLDHIASRHVFMADLSAVQRKGHDEAMASGAGQVAQLPSLVDAGARDDAASAAEAWEKFRAGLAAMDAEPDAARRRAIQDEQVGPAAEDLSRRCTSIRTKTMATLAEIAAAGRRQEQVANWTVTITMIVAAGVALACVEAVRRGIMRPTRQLAAALQKVEQNEFENLELPRTRDEFGRLGEALSRVAGTLREYRQSDVRRLARTEQLTQIAIDSLPEAIAMVGADGRVEISNAPARRLFGILPGGRIEDLPHKWLAEMFRAARQNRLRI